MSLTRLLSGRHLLLVLDNFEHVLTEVNLQTISKMLSSSTQLNIIATSRSALNINGEHVFAVRPLAVPNTFLRAQAEAGTHNLTGLAQQPAVALFLSRAQSVNVDFKLTQANAQSLCSLCAFSEGIPLVLELLAARTRLLSTQQLLAQISAPDHAPTSADFLTPLHISVPWPKRFCGASTCYNRQSSCCWRN